MKIALVTGGGDCPGLNACIRAIVRTCLLNGATPVGSKDGWLGLIDNNIFEMDTECVSNILDRGGTILGTSRTDPVSDKDNLEKLKNNMSRSGIEGIIVLGGNGTLSAASELSDAGIKVIGIPKTIDKDIPHTEDTIGFDTAVNIVMEAIDRLHSTAEAHHRTIVMEVMGRTSGWIAAAAGIAGGADCIIIPEENMTVDDIEKIVRQKYGRGKRFSIVVIAEGASIPGLRKPDIGKDLARELEKRTGFETRSVDLGHVQRGGTPTAADRILATRLGVAAVDEAIKGNFGVMIGTKGSDIITVKLSDVKGIYKGDDHIRPFYTVGRVFFG